MADTRRKAAIIGAGPVGCLMAISLAKMGWRVEVYEGRPDMRLPTSKAATQQRSINLAISSRGITALQSILDPTATARFLDSVIPMKGRMIHDVNGKLDSQLYDRHGQCINSIDRALLNENLLTNAIETPNVRVIFNHKIQSIDFDSKVLVARDADSGSDAEVAFDLCVGADGSYSITRRQLMRVMRMDYQQTYIPHEYLELKMPPGKGPNGEPQFQLDCNHLHIWPRHSFMLIALPNKDYTFTCTLFAPTESFDELATYNGDEQLKWFGSNFPDALEAIGAETLLRDLKRNPRSPLISVKANPYHYKDCAILLGDAAHSMVPFYGQGLNCGLEDVRVLTALLREAGVAPISVNAPNGIDERLAGVLEKYSRTRHADLVAICDMAMNNYVEMRHDVTTPAYLFRKTLDNLLAALTSTTPPTTSSYTETTASLAEVPFSAPCPRGWLPLYTMVTFRPDISYAVARAKAEHQAKTLSVIGWAAGATASVGIVGGLAWAAHTLGWLGVRSRR